MKKIRTQHGQSTLEVAALIMFLLAAYVVSQKFIVRGIVGQWKKVGDTFGEGRIYDPNRSVRCAANVFFPQQSAVWYDRDCFDDSCKEHCLEVTKDPDACLGCLVGCQSDYCDQGSSG